MANATSQAQVGIGASVAWFSAENGIAFSRDDIVAGTTPTPTPTATGTHFSWLKNCVISVLVTGTTTISNRTIALASALPTGLNVYWKAVAVASYAQATSGNQPADSGSNGATPVGYTLMSTTPATYDATGVATSSTGPNGGMAVCVLGIDNTYTGLPGAAITEPTIIINWTEV